MQTRFIAGAAAGILTLGLAVVPTATAQDSDPQSGSTGAAPARASLSSPVSTEASYSDRDVLKLLLAGQGQLASDRPELLNVLGFSADKPASDEGALDRVVSDYLSAHPDFHETVSVPFQSGDPARIDSALATLTRNFNSFLDESGREVDPAVVGQDGGATARGWAWAGANVVIYANAVGVANAVGYANVGVATLALATIAFVTWYLPDGSGMAGDPIDHENRIAQIATALR
ncbi:hypothetical protein [Rhodococcus sp. NBC_00294]|uniref:hypothetical protein n=1 Tax=Rhodococcus sp. NBC_00294 TaxID=2976004 RepID=UPI002E28C210|nr:hypothetical protein [Rhodococcus sp. NBC_00294]